MQLIFTNFINHDVLSVILQQYSKHNSLILTTSAETRNVLKQYCNVQFISVRKIQQNNDFWIKKDGSFFENFMPGILGEICYADTNLPVHKVISIDRLNMFYDFESYDIEKTLSLLNIDEILLPLNFFDIYTGIVINFALQNNIPIKYVDVIDHHSQEYFLALNALNPEFVFYTSSLADKSKTINGTCIDYFRTQISEIDKLIKKTNLRHKLRIDNDEKLVGIVYDKKFERKYNMFIQEIADDKVIFMATDERSKQLLNTCLQIDVPVYGIEFVDACDEIIRFYED